MFDACRSISASCIGMCTLATLTLGSSGVMICGSGVQLNLRKTQPYDVYQWSIDAGDPVLGAYGQQWQTFLPSVKLPTAARCSSAHMKPPILGCTLGALPGAIRYLMSLSFMPMQAQGPSTSDHFLISG